MKKIIVAGAALLMTGGGYAVADNAFAGVSVGDDETVKVEISGDARFRFTFKDKYDFGNDKHDHPRKRHDSRMRVRIKATTAGGAYAVGRIRVAEGWGENNDCDGASCQSGNTWSDEAYIGVPFGDGFTMEVGKYRVNYGTGFFYDDLPMSGVRGIIKAGDWEINPFVEWESEAEGSKNTFNDNLGSKSGARFDHDAIRYGVHAGGRVADGWKVGGLVAYQSDGRNGRMLEDGSGYRLEDPLEPYWSDIVTKDKGREGWMAMLYVDGKSGPFGLKAEFAYNDGSLKGFNLNSDDTDFGRVRRSITRDLYWNGQKVDSKTETFAVDYDDGFGGYIQPSYTIDALTLALNAGFAINGFTPDTNWGLIMLGSSQLAISVADINSFSDSTWWVGLIASYAISDDLKATGIFAFADMTPFDWAKGRGAGVASLEHAFELSARLDYAVTKNLAFTWAIGTLFASFDDPDYEDDNPWGTLFQFNYKF